MADIINLVDDDDGYANKKRSLKCRPRHSAQIKNEQQFDCANDERSLRRLRRHSAQSKYEPKFGNANDEKSRKRRRCNSAENRYNRSLPNHREEEERDEKYAVYLDFFAGEDEGSGFQNVDNNISSDTDVQYAKFLSCLKRYKNSYVLNLVKADGTSKLLTYEDDGMTSDQPRHDTSRNATGVQEEKGGMLHHISETMLDNRNGKGLKSTNETSKTVSRLVTKHRMGMENARYSSHRDSLIADPKITPLEPVGTESRMRSIDDSYKFFLMHEKKFMYPQDSKKCSIRSEAGNATKEKLIKHMLGSNVYSRNMFDGKQGKRPRLSQDSGNGAHKTMDATKVTQKALVGHKCGTTDNARQKVDNKQGGTNRHCRDLENGVKRTIVGEVMGMRASNDKLGKRCRLSDDSKTVGRSSRASKVTQDATGATVHLAETPDNKQGKKRRLSGDSKKATKKASADKVTEEATGLHTSHGKQSSGMKSCPKNHHQPGSGFKGSQLKFGGNVDDSYKALLSGLREHKGQLMFQSEDGKVVIYERDWNKECSTDSDSDSDSDSVIIIDEKDFNNNKFCSVVPRKSSFKDMELDKSRTRNDSSFREELMNILSKPYDQDEYKSLMKEASKRRPLERHGELRGGRKRTCELESLGKSYLDQYNDVAEAIEDSRDDHRKLILLRGFMFWLENIARDGKFKPWIDKKCWEALGMSRSSKRHKH